METWAFPAGADRWLRWLIVTPWMHWVHHSDYQPETDSNFSSVFSFWDRIFGSFRLVADPRALTLGLEDMERRREWATLPGMVAMPFRRRRDGGGDGGGDDGGPGGTPIAAPLTIRRSDRTAHTGAGR